jgi:hypothetical protein
MDPDNKGIHITGTHNRYQIKKLKKEPTIVKKRKETEDCPTHWFDIDKQFTLITDIYSTTTQTDVIKYTKSQIDHKLSGYRQQDLEKDRYNESHFIRPTEVVKKLYDCSGTCYYCKQDILLLYENVRDGKQWTLDRVDNDIGHTQSNVIISCLSCNLRRRRTSSTAFLFTKQLSIIKSV